MEIETANIHNFTIRCKQCGSQAILIDITHGHQPDTATAIIQCLGCANKEEFDE